MSIDTQHIVGVNGSSDGLPAASASAPARSASRPRNVLRLPAFAAPQSSGSYALLDEAGSDCHSDSDSDEMPRLSGVRCRIGMAYLD